jgi:hypothetical protein
VTDDGFIIRRNRKGRGVYARRRFRRGAIMCACPVLVWPRGRVPDAFIWQYIWEWDGKSGLPLGIISMCNHSPSPNMGTRCLYANRRMICRALRDIRVGEEILIDYGPASGNFEVL